MAVSGGQEDLVVEKAFNNSTVTTAEVLDGVPYDSVIEYGALAGRAVAEPIRSVRAARPPRREVFSSTTSGARSRTSSWRVREAAVSSLAGSGDDREGATDFAATRDEAFADFGLTIQGLI